MNYEDYLQGKAKLSQVAIHMQRKIMPKNVHVLRDGKQRTKPCVLENERTMILLAKAFLVGANQTEAAEYAGCSRSVLKKHIHSGTMIEYETEVSSEKRISTFGDLVSLWRSHITLLCKMNIYADIINPHSDTKSAWKVLNRRG